MKRFCVLFAAAIVLCFPVRTGAQNSVPKDAADAFVAAGIPVLKERVDPVDFSLPLLEGGEAVLSAYRGKVVFLNFWATWCPPCRSEMPSMEALYQRFKDRGFEMLAVNCAENRDTVQRFIKNNKYSFPVPLDESRKAGNQYGIEGIPTTFILDREGKIIARVVGSLRWDNAKIISAFETLLGNP